MPQYPYNLPLAATRSAAVTAAGQVVTGNGILAGFSITSPGTTWVVSVYDGTSTSGTLLYTFTAVDGPLVVPPTRFSTGLYIGSAGTAGSLTVSYYGA